MKTKCKYTYNNSDIIECWQFSRKLLKMWNYCELLNTRDVPNIRFVFASMPNRDPNSVFVFGRIVSSERIRIVSLHVYSAELETSTANFTQPGARCSRSDRLIMGDD